MSKKRLDEMSEVEFNSLLDGYIERTATGCGEMPADFFLDLETRKKRGRALWPPVRAVNRSSQDRARSMLKEDNCINELICPHFFLVSIPFNLST